MDEDPKTLLEMVSRLQSSKVGDPGRLAYIRHAIDAGKTVYRTDRKYVTEKYSALTLPAPPSIPDAGLKKNLSASTGPAHNCELCTTELHLKDKVVRSQEKWYHLDCFRQTLKNTATESVQVGKTETQIMKKPEVIKQVDYKTPKASSKKPNLRADPVLVLLAVTIFALLIYTAYSLFSYLSIISISLAAVLVLFQITTRTSPQQQYHYKRRGASFFSLSVMVMPFGLGTIIAFDGYVTGALSVVQTIFIWGLTLSFWQTMLFVPLAIRSIMRESLLEVPSEYPRISVLVPAYNEEKVIQTTIESLLATDYPDKEIIAIDDGSKDDTLTILSNYKDKIKVIHKENGGKASALNAGMLYATGSIITILDADTIIGHSALKNIARSFTQGNVAAVAGNIKIRNRINILTWCQALEYLSGIQIMRRGLDYFGAITIVPGALGAFKKQKLEEAGSYHKETLVEDFDATMKVLRSGMIVSGSNTATAYTQGPHSLKDFYNQRKRWYRGNCRF